MKTILKINASARYQDSVSRQLVDMVVEKIKESSDHIIERDLTQEIHFVSEASLNAVRQLATNTPPILLVFLSVFAVVVTVT